MDGIPVSPAREAQGALEAKGSRFFGFLIPIDAFDARLEALQTEHRKATHFVTATRILTADGRVEERARDDGEPGGTAGMPVLRVLIGAGIVNAGCVVVRYFGGTKLGTGGLARAYGGAASRAVDAARLRPFVRMDSRTLRCGFADLSALEHLAGSLGLEIGGRRFTEDGATVTLTGPMDTLGDPALDRWKA